MALSDAQKLTICTILGVTPIRLDEHLAFYPPTAAVETAIGTELTRWATAGTVFESVEAKDRNFGVRYNPAEEKADIRKNIAVLLHFDANQFWGNRLVRA